LLAYVAAEAREFDGFLANAERVVKLNWPLSFARIVWLNGRAGLLVANGPGPKLAGQALDVVREKRDLQRLNVNLELTGLASTGFCGALDPALKPCDIFVANQVIAGTAVYDCGSVASSRAYKTGKLLSMDRVASTAAEKSELRATGADAVEMEASAVADKAKEWNLPFYAIRVVTDTASESFPLDFNRMRDAEGRFDRTRIITAALRRPGVIFPELLKLNKRCRSAAKALGEFIADSRI
jgi:adenosylhomocysteine nucleosidase